MRSKTTHFVTVIPGGESMMNRPKSEVGHRKIETKKTDGSSKDITEQRRATPTPMRPAFHENSIGVTRFKV
jgi:hypothetical protein